MTISLTGAAVDTGVPAQNVRAPSNPVIATSGTEAQAIARQQLASAVPAPALLAAYSTGIAPQNKPAAKPLSSAPSSPFAAQFIAQDAGSEGDLALFELPPPLANPAAENTPADDYLNDLRIARGDFSAVNKSAPTQDSETTETVQARQIAKPAATVASETTQRSSTAALPPVFGRLERRENFSQGKGVGAYQMAQTRNALIRRAPEPVNVPVPELVH